MNRLAIIVLAAAAVSSSASAQYGAPPTTGAAQPSRDDADGTMLNGKDRIGLTATQRQMIAWSIAGIAEMQPVPPDFRPQPGTKVPSQVNLSQVPAMVEGVAPPAAGYEYAMFDDKILLLLQDGTIADVIHLNRRL
ncbi:hypothetical protein [Bradyrhizobium sp.]|uniref:hypothetical protein n=1 Tax=Bradyrhizobium sp. TaxID=376 RepID=UPI0026168872|nr:hypothetical protein [Bradyrhizobium sp.]